MIKSILVLLLTSAIVSAGLAKAYLCSQNAYGHNFSPNSLSTFLTLSHRADIELTLADSNFPSNVTLALDHAENAIKLMDDVYYSDDDIVFDTDFIARYYEAVNSRNASVHALVVANIADQILKEYGEAFGIEYDLTNMSNMMMPTLSNSDSRSYPSDSTDMNISVFVHSNNVEGNSNSAKIVNMHNYQSAQQLSERVYVIFKNQLQPLATSSNNTNSAIPKVDKNLFSLKHLVSNKASVQELMMLVHGQLHPNLQFA